MVCDKSLYCLKYGPCASHTTRKQIWEENWRLRESFKNLNRADHYWSFQTVPQPIRVYSHGPEESNHHPCSSVTHSRLDSPVKLIPKNKVKDACTETTPPTRKKPPLIPTHPAETPSPPSASSPTPVPIPYERPKSSSQPDLTRIPPQIQPPCARVRPSRTTRQTLLPPKTVPFAPYGCNNQSGELAGKKTHNVRAAPNAVHPAALAALQRRKETLSKLIYSEENQLRDTLRKNSIQKPVNHSSLWATEYSRSFKDKKNGVPNTTTLRKVYSQANIHL